MNKIVVVDYGMGNLRSVAQALRHVAPEADVRISGEVADLRAADRVVLPGQGAMRDCMRSLRSSGLEEAVIASSKTKPLLGVCVGEQMLFEGSDEGDTPGLALFAGRVRRFSGPAFQTPADGAMALKVPHMGWNAVRQTRSHPLWRGVPQDTPFYFVHSYYAVPQDEDAIAGTALYGHDFCCAIAAANIFAVQFHPEKSAAPGLQIYRNFVHWQP